MSQALNQLRRALHLAKSKQPVSMRESLGYLYGPEPESYSTAPEIAEFSTPQSKPTANTHPELTPQKFADMANAATRPTKRPPAFGTTFVPHSDHIVEMAKFGSPAKGEYQNAFNTVTELFGFHPHGVAVWLAANAALSPNTAYPQHAAAATHFTANWLALPENLKRDEQAMRNILADAVKFGKLYTPELADSLRRRPGNPRSQYNPAHFDPKTGQWLGIRDPSLREEGAGDDLGATGMTYGGTIKNAANIDRLIGAVQNIDRFMDAIHDPQHPDKGMGLDLMGGGGLLKVPNFSASYTGGQFGTALDTHMNRWLFHPLLGEIFSQGGVLNELERQLSPSKFGKIRDLARSNIPVQSQLVRELMKHPNLRITFGTKDGKPAQESIPGVLKILNGKLTSNPSSYAAYKHAVADAARKLGWTNSAVQESVWTGLVSLMAANGIARDYKIPLDVIHEHLTADAIRKGWENLGFFLFPAALDAYRRAGVDPARVTRVADAAREAAAASSRGRRLPSSVTTGVRRVAPYLPGSMSQGIDAAGPVRKGMLKTLADSFAERGIDINSLKRFQATGEPLRLAQYDAALPFQSALQRVTAANYKTFVEQMKKILTQSGIIPQEVAPAIHDVGGAARVSLFAAGTYKNPASPGTAAAWTGMLGRQPGMLSFASSPTGQDSVYRFHHGDADTIQQVLDANGVKGRTLVPRDKAFAVYIYDKGRQKREAVGRAATQLGVPVDEWYGTGTPVGGDVKDMGRAQYRDVINASESGRV